MTKEAELLISIELNQDQIGFDTLKAFRKKQILSFSRLQIKLYEIKVDFQTKVQISLSIKKKEREQSRSIN